MPSCNGNRDLYAQCDLRSPENVGKTRPVPLHPRLFGQNGQLPRKYRRFETLWAKPYCTREGRHHLPVWDRPRAGGARTRYCARRLPTMEALCGLNAGFAARLRPHRLRGQVLVVLVRPLAIVACARGSDLDDPRQASSGVSRQIAVGIQHRANPGGQVPLPVFRGTFFVATALHGVHRHGKSLAFQRWMDRWTSRSFRQLFAHGSILPSARRSFNDDLDAADFDGQSILIKIRRGRDATAMQAITRRATRPSGRPPALRQFLATRRLTILTQTRRSRAPRLSRAARGGAQRAEQTAAARHDRRTTPLAVNKKTAGSRYLPTVVVAGSSRPRSRETLVANNRKATRRRCARQEKRVNRRKNPSSTLIFAI